MEDEDYVKRRLCARTGSFSLRTHATDRVCTRWRAGERRLLRAAVNWARAKLARRLWVRYRPRLSRDDADEIAVAAVERAWLHRASFHAAKGTLKAWLWVIANHKALDELRGWWRRRRHTQIASDNALRALLDARVITANGAGDKGAREIRPDLLEALNEVLSAKELAVIVADAYSKAGTAQAGQLAATLDVSPTTVRVLRFRARCKARAELGRRGLAPKPFDNGARSTIDRS